MKRILPICIVALLIVNITTFTQNEKPKAAPQKVDGYIFKNSDTMLLTEPNLCNLDYRLLSLARNEIYARHGYIFKDKSLQEYFRNRKWYSGFAVYTGKLSELEKKNVELIKKFEGFIKRTETDNNYTRTIPQQSDFDLNGDGNTDKIKYHLDKNEYDFSITINGIIIKDKGECMANYINIVDIDESDNIKEIAVEEYGPSDDYFTHFYYYDGSKIIKMGVLGGLTGTYKHINGKGLVTSRTRFDSLATWFLKYEYLLTPTHTLQHIEKPYYYIVNNEEPATVLKSIHLYAAQNSKKVVAKLLPGEKVKFIGANDKGWFLVKTTNGKTGWFATYSKKYHYFVKESGLDTLSVFSGLYCAD